MPYPIRKKQITDPVHTIGERITQEKSIGKQGPSWYLLVVSIREVVGMCDTVFWKGRWHEIHLKNLQNN